MNLPAPLPDFLRVRGYEDLIQRETVLGIYGMLYDLLDAENPDVIKAFTFAELVNCSKYPKHRVTNAAVLEYIKNSISIYGVDPFPDGRLYIQPTIMTIILAATEPAEVGFRLLRLSDVIEIP
jgi:hypothetical protein